MIGKLGAWLLIAAGVFNVAIWPRFARAIIADERAWADGVTWQDPTGFFWVHFVMIVTAISFGLTVFVIGVRALRSRP